MVKKTNNQRGVDHLQREPCGQRVQLLVREFQQHAKGVAVRTDRMWAGLPLLHQALGEETFQQGAKLTVEVVMSGHSQHRSETAHCLMHQLWPRAEIPKRVADVDMAKIGRQEW